MARFVVSYDLRAPGRNYQPLYDRLHNWEAVCGLESLWFIKWDSTPTTIRDDLKKYVDANDGLFVAQISASAWSNLKGDSGATLSAWYKGA